MSFSVPAQILTGSFKVADGTTRTLASQSVVGFSSIGFSVFSSKAIVFQVLAGRSGSEVIIEKTLPAGKLYFRAIDAVADFVHVKFVNASGADATVQIEATLSFTRQPNNLCRQHIILDKTNNIGAVRQGITYDLDLIRGHLQGQSDPHIEGITGTLSTTARTLWIDSGTADVFDSQATASVVTLTSTSTDDQANTGTGARKVTVHGLDENSLEVSDIVSMVGTGTNTTTKTFLRVNSMEVTETGSALHNVGTITAKIGTDVLEKINATDSISKTAHFSVPASNVLLMEGVHFTSNVSDEISVYVYESPMTSATDGTPTAKRLLKEVPISSGTQYVSLRRKVSQLTTIVIEVQSTATPLGTNSISAKIDGTLINEVF